MSDLVQVGRSAIVYFVHIENPDENVDFKAYVSVEVEGEMAYITRWRDLTGNAGWLKNRPYRPHDEPNYATALRYAYAILQDYEVIERRQIGPDDYEYFAGEFLNDKG